MFAGMMLFKVQQVMLYAERICLRALAMCPHVEQRRERDTRKINITLGAASFADTTHLRKEIVL